MSERCIDGRLMRHVPFPTDPDFEQDVGQCPDCNGNGCEPSEAMLERGREFALGLMGVAESNWIDGFNKGLEEAAKLVEKAHDGAPNPQGDVLLSSIRDGMQYVLARVAKAIRALAKASRPEARSVGEG